MTDDYEDDSPEAWLAYLPEILTAVDEGNFDQHLTDIATRVIARMAKEPDLMAIAKFTMSQAKTLGFVGGKDGVPGVKATAKVPVGAVAYTGHVVGENGVPLFPASKFKPARGAIEYENANYRKSSIEGKVVRLKKPDGESGMFWMDGVLMKIHSCGPKFFQARFVEDPTEQYPDSYKLREWWNRQLRNSDAYCRIPYVWINHTFGA